MEPIFAQLLFFLALSFIAFTGFMIFLFIKPIKTTEEQDSNKTIAVILLLVAILLLVYVLSVVFGFGRAMAV